MLKLKKTEAIKFLNPASLRRISTVVLTAFVGAVLVRIGAHGPQLISNIGAGSPYNTDDLKWTSGIVPFLGVGAVALISVFRSDLFRWWQWALFASCGATIFVGYFSFPPTTSSSNSRIHWVDWRLVPAARDDLRYLVTRLLRVTEWQVSNPWLVGAALTSFSVLMIFGYGKRQGWPVAVSLCVSSALIFSGPLGLFTNPSEDASTVFAIMAATALLMTFRRVRLVALVLPTLVRPEFVTIWLAFLALGASECLAGFAQVLRKHQKDRISLRNAFGRSWKTLAPFLKTLAGAFLLFVALQFVLYDALGRRWFLIGGQLIDETATASVVPREIDGWTISPFSGTYIFHFLWMFPTFLILAVFATGTIFFSHKRKEAITELERKETPRERELNTTNFLLFWCLAILMLHEAKPILYFNTRYLSYAIFPALLAAGGIVSKALKPAIESNPRNLPPRSLAYLTALLAVMLLPTSHAERREINLHSDYSSWVLYRNVLVEYGSTTPILTLDHRPAIRNSISYYFDVPVGQVKLVGPDDLKANQKSGAVAVCFRDCEILWTDNWDYTNVSGVFLWSG